MTKPREKTREELIAEIEEGKKKIRLSFHEICPPFTISRDGGNSVGLMKPGNSPPPALQRAGRYCMIGKTANI